MDVSATSRVMPFAGQFDYDIAILSDLRYPGGNSASIVEEIKAQAAAGYSTALIHMPAGHMKRRRTFNHRIIHCLSAGLATLESATRRLNVRALLIRQPRIFADPVVLRPRVRAETAVLVVNHPPFDGRFPVTNPYYRVDEVRGRVEALFGPVAWAPIGPLVRRALVQAGAGAHLTADDWHNIVEVDEWCADRSRFVSSVPVIGRHSRDHAVKWPSDRDEILAAYPADDRVAVRILGGASAARAVLGRLPASWTVYPFGGLSPAAFLAQIDVFVYFHHPDWVEAFGRNVIEAMASGAPAILPESFRSLFGDAALYSTPAGVRDLVEGLYADADAYAERSRRGVELVSQRFGADVHVRRLHGLIGEPRGQRRRPPSRSLGRRRRVLLVSTETTGLGSVARLLRLARMLPRDIEPVFVVAVPCMDVLARNGFLSDHVPVEAGSRDGARRRLARRLGAIIEREEPTIAVVEGRSVHRGVADAVRDAAQPFVWITTRQVMPTDDERAPFAKTVRLASVSEHDGSGHDHEGSVLHVGAFLPDLSGRAELGHPPVREGTGAQPRALVALGADARTVDGTRTAEVAAILVQTGFQPVIADPVVGPRPEGLPSAAELHELDLCGRDLDGFDLAVIAPTHVCVHDVIAAGIPWVVVPARVEPRHDRTADQLAGRGLGVVLRAFDPSVMAETFSRLRDADERRRAAARSGSLDLSDGTPLAAALVERMVRGVDSALEPVASVV